MNTPVTFPIAKLLKEKGFDNICKEIYAYGNPNTIENLAGLNNSDDRGYLSAPTIAEVIMWLYEKHKLWIYTHKDGGWWFPVVENYYNESDEGTIIEDLSPMKIKVFDSPTEAYSKAIEYTLTNLI